LTTHHRAELAELGWNDHFAEAFETWTGAGLEPARIAADFGSGFLTLPEDAPSQARLAQHLREAGRPVAVGDWVAVRRIDGAREIREVLPRFSAVRRKAAEADAVEQVLAANVDLIFIAAALGSDFNPRRVERLLTVAYQSGAGPVILLMKSDLDDDAAYRAEVEAAAPGVPVIAVSGVDGTGIDRIREQLTGGRTGVLVGSSGVGKSTLINRLVGTELLRTGAIHDGSGQGRHTTSRRQLLMIPGAGMIIDTPGLREVQLWAGAEVMGQVFADIESLAGRCRFTDCRHEQEPECAVLAAMQNGTLDANRLANYRKMVRELRAIEVRADLRLQVEARRKWKVIHRSVREHVKQKRRWG
jgi:ribosome biogenesis GTPase / thiamine phosphate phosphatase